MTERVRQWLLAGIVFTLVVAVAGAWLGYINARNTPHYRQTEPGAVAVPDQNSRLQLRLVSLVTTATMVTSRDSAHAPAGALYVVAVVEYVPDPDGSLCWLDLLAVDGRRWATTELTEVPLADVDCRDCACAPTNTRVVTPKIMLPAITPMAHLLFASEFLVRLIAGLPPRRDPPRFRHTVGARGRSYVFKSPRPSGIPQNQNWHVTSSHRSGRSQWAPIPH